MPRYGYGYPWGGYCACPCTRPYGAWPTNREDVIEELKDYKLNLESEIGALEKRIKALKEKAE